MQFSDLHLITPILKALEAEGYTHPTPIQAQAIPSILARKDIFGSAQTGTGKTAAFAIPTLQILAEKPLEPHRPRPIRALVLTPTRELAIQIQESFLAYGKNLNLHSAVIFGGVSQFGQTAQLRKGIDILVATPGRLIDLIGQGFIDLKQIEIFILDEADQMLNMGFINDVKKVLAKLPLKKQSLFFSATIPNEILHLAQSILKDPVRVEVAPVTSTAEKVDQSVYFVQKSDKKSLLVHLLKDRSIESVLVFTRTKHGADKVVKDLDKAGIPAAAIHGNKSQNARQLALKDFKSKKTRVLIATDIAARGIDIDDLSHVINYELPNTSETYIHRIGRTGRAGLSGIALSFCDHEEQEYLHDIHKLIGKTIPTVKDHPYAMTPLPINIKAPASSKGNTSQNRRYGDRRRGGRG